MGAKGWCMVGEGSGGGARKPWRAGKNAMAMGKNARIVAIKNAGRKLVQSRNNTGQGHGHLSRELNKFSK